MAKREKLLNFSVVFEGREWSISVPPTAVGQDIINMLIQCKCIPDGNYAILISPSLQKLQKVSEIPSSTLLVILRSSASLTQSISSHKSPHVLEKYNKELTITDSPGNEITGSEKRGSEVRIYEFEKHEVLLKSDSIEEQLRIAYRTIDIPNPMRVGEMSVVKLEIARLMETLEKRLEKRLLEIKVSDKVRVSLRGEDFEISENFNSIYQYLPEKDKAQWSWNVTPIKSGKRKLIIQLSTTIKHDSLGLVEKDYPYHTEEIEVTINPVYTAKEAVRNNWQWFIGLIAGTGVIWKAIEYYTKHPQ